MKVTSPVGTFPFEPQRLELDQRRLRIEGAMGAWPAHVELEPGDARKILRVLARGLLTSLSTRSRRTT